MRTLRLLLSQSGKTAKAVIHNSPKLLKRPGFLLSLANDGNYVKKSPLAKNFQNLRIREIRWRQKAKNFINILYQIPPDLYLYPCLQDCQSCMSRRGMKFCDPLRSNSGYLFIWLNWQSFHHKKSWSWCLSDAIMMWTIYHWNKYKLINLINKHGFKEFWGR